MKGLTRKERKQLGRIFIATAMLVICKLLPVTGPAAAACYLVPYLFIGWDILYGAVRNILHGQIFDEDFLMSIATVGAFATAEYAEAVFVMLFFRTGEWFEHYAVGKSRKSIAALMDIRPDTANLETEHGLMEVDPEDVSVGDVIVVKPGERIPLDGTVIEGSSALDTAALTGESLPRDVTPGDQVLSGCVNQNGMLRIRITRLSHESTVSKILDLVENASEKKSTSEQFITRFARYYTPCVVIAAAALALIPPLFAGGWSEWFHRALIFLVVSCPCALVISVPLSFFGGIGGASKCGILVKGSNYLEALAQADTIVFDKTGTLTKGVFHVASLRPSGDTTEKHLLSMAALAERYSDHPIAQSLRAACETLPNIPVTNVKELAGFGLRAMVGDKSVLVGSSRLMAQEGVTTCNIDLPGTLVHVAEDGCYLGCIRIADQVKEDAARTIKALKRSGVKRTVMLTGDTESTAKAIANELGLDGYYAQLLPADKVVQLEHILFQQATGQKLAYVGDGINDAPVLTRADIGIAMGALGSDAAIEAADIVLMDDKPSRIVDAIRISRKTLRIVRQNIVFALGVKGLALLLGALGYASMWMAVFADVGVAFIAILNAMRCLHIDAQN